ncbi:hypothetical protein DYBT9275_05781 [Dyadobacter sp. CECT 9275]|uniref:Polyketide cyclase n=1 Tax=Dyadobacter helix TaxID=2822344 RepID=A0A916NNW6_9BACT|nr:SRPBCC family protein [Dyadobacter sp. CECT 9275]CAG5017480.1 hypothetical protein DYBT9275_05781 [Dyadobacter sp. CECT 9275]
MKIIKKILIVIAAIIILLLVVALFTKKDYTIERNVTINKPKQEVFDYIRLLKNQSYYSVWVMRDPQVKREFKGTDGTEGFVTTWESTMDEVGKGEQEITKVVDGEAVDSHLHFIKPFEGQANASMTTQAISDTQTKVNWKFSSSMAYPMNIMLVFISMEDMLGKDMSDGLHNLKAILEK